MQTDCYIFFFYNKEYFLISIQYTTSAYFYASYNDTWIINLHGLHKDRCHVLVVLFLWFRKGMNVFSNLWTKLFLKILSHVTLAEFENRPPNSDVWFPSWSIQSSFIYSSHSIQFHHISPNLIMIVIDFGMFFLYHWNKFCLHMK